jgi:hypothetical protein
MTGRTPPKILAKVDNINLCQTLAAFTCLIAAKFISEIKTVTYKRSLAKERFVKSFN